MVKTPPVAEPITLQEAKEHCQIDADITGDDALVTGYITAAREFCEQYTRRYFGEQTLVYQGNFHSPMELTPNLKSVSSLKYLDSTETEKSLPATEYAVGTASIVGQIVFYNGWPAVKEKHPEPVTIEFIAGIEAPELVKVAMKLLISHWYENRQAVGRVTGETEFSVTSILDRFRVPCL